MSELSTPFRERAASALGDRFLRQALTIATTKFIDLRREAFDSFPEGEALRDRARQIKEATLQQLDRYLAELIDNGVRFTPFNIETKTPPDFLKKPGGFLKKPGGVFISVRVAEPWPAQVIRGGETPCMNAASPGVRSYLLRKAQ